MPLENLKKHSGQLSNTGVRVAVVFRKLPNDDNSCLIVETERLPDSYHDTIMQCLNSKEASETNEFYEVLNRRTFPDGTNCLTSLHQRGFLRKEPIANVNMLPLPGQVVPLALINATIDKKIDEYMARERDSVQPDSTIPVTTASISPEDTSRDPVEVARGLIMQAELMEQDAAEKRERAYALAPELKPGRGRPPTPEELKEQKMEERKAKRRERDRARAAEARAEKQESVIDSRVSAKIRRDEARLNQAE